MKRSISFNLFIRALTILSLCAGLIGAAGLTPRSAQANVQPSCSTAPLFTNGTFITGTDDVAGSADTSSPQSPDTGFGYLVDPTRTQSTPDSVNRARLADDFTVTGNGWRPNAITLYAYQINSGTTSPITGVVDLRLWNGTPGEGGTVIAGPVTATITNNQWTGVYRVPSNDLTQTSRPIMAVTINWPFTITTLLTGTYWLEWGMAGSASLSGPWVPPTNAATGDNARQLNLTGGEPGTWAPRNDYTSGRTVGLPFVICGDTIPTPQITSLSPDQAVAGSAEFTLTVNGSGFINGTGSDRSVVHWNGSPRTTTFVSSTVLTATIPASDIATAGTANVTVVNPGNLTSNTATFTINNPSPTITTISPATAVAGSGNFTLTITGTNFVNGAVVRWNGSDRTTTFVSSTQLTAAIPASDVATAGTANVTVFNPAPGGGESGAVTFTINNPAPTISSISPATAVAGSGNFTLTITGTNFVTNSVVRWNGSPRPTTFVSSTQLTAAIPASDIATAGTASVTVFNPAPGGGTSNTATFTIQASNPAPTITTISPSTTVAGSGGFTLTITGTNFVNGSVVRWNGIDRLTTFVSSTRLEAAIPASDVATAGTANVTVFNPAPGGGTSNTAIFTIQASNPAPTISSISPATAVAGSDNFTLTITGTNFVNGAVVRWNGSDRTTTFVSSTRLEAAIPASDIATAGTANVTVFNPAPGGGESGAVTFTIQDNTVGSPQQYRVMLPLITR